MNFFEKDKKNSFFLTNLEIESAYKNFSELTSEEITSIKKIKSENEVDYIINLQGDEPLIDISDIKNLS